MYIYKMANFQQHTFLNFDEYMTPKSAWDNIKEYIPKDKIIWEAFYGDGKSGQYLKELGFNVIDEPIDFFENNLGDIVVSNPPFSSYIKCLERLIALDKPFILILPCSKICTLKFKELFVNNENKLQLIVPKKRIQFQKKVDGVDKPSNACNFDCFYYCWQMDLPNDLIFIK